MLAMTEVCTDGTSGISFDDVLPGGAKPPRERDFIAQIEARNMKMQTMDGNTAAAYVSYAFTEADSLMTAIKDVAVSSGAACSSASLESSYVLRACGVDEQTANGSIRFGIGRFNNEEEVEYVANLVAEKVEHLRQQSPLYRQAADARKTREAGSVSG